jgi:putative transposase
MLRRSASSLKLSRLSKGGQRSVVRRTEQLIASKHPFDLALVSEEALVQARDRADFMRMLEASDGAVLPQADRFARRHRVSRRTVLRWLRQYRTQPNATSLLPKRRGPRIGRRRLSPNHESIIATAIDAWSRRTEPLPLSWIVEECTRQCRSRRIEPVSRNAILARVRDRGLQALRSKGTRESAQVPLPRAARPLDIVQIDHTLVDIMVVDEVYRKSVGRPWISVAFDLASRMVMGFHLSLEPPCVTSVGLTLTMAALPKHEWLKERGLELSWEACGLPRVLHLDNGSEFHSMALQRGCARHGIRLEYRPPGRPYYGAHIERYLGTLMRRIHGLPGTTFSNPVQRGRYPSEAKAAMTLPELERWVALEIAGRYHQRIHAGVHAIPVQLWARTIGETVRLGIADPKQFVIDFLPTQLRRIGRNGFQLGHIRYWDPLLSRLFPYGTRVLVHYDPRDLSKVFVPSPDDCDYLIIPYADLRRPPITLAEREHAQSMLSKKGQLTSEDQIFAATATQRRLEEQARHRTRRARRNIERRPATEPPARRPGSHSKVDYSRPVIPYEGEEW